MARYLVMLGLCVIVGAVMALVLVRFFKRLNEIEEKRWGKKAQPPKK